jgi:hypothetical protein
MARKRRARPYVNLRAGGNNLPPLINFNAPGGPRITTLNAQGRPVRETIQNGEFALPQVGGLRIRRGVRTNYGVRDLVVDQQGNVLSAIAAGSNPNLRFSTSGPDGGRRLVVGRGSATTGGGAAPTTPGADTFTYGFKPNDATLKSRFGEGGYDVKQVNGKWVVTRKPAAPAGPADPYADYNDYPFIKNYLSGMDRQYDAFQSYLTNTYNPQVTAGSQALTNARLASGNAYNAAIQNISNSAGTVASAMTTPQIAGMTGGTVQAPNQNALGAAQSMAATTNVGRNLDAGYRTAMGGLEAEKMGQSFLSSAMGYGAGLLNQYGQKRQAERLKMDQWIYEQKAAAAEAKSKNDLALAKLDQSMINSLIISGDKAAARDATAAEGAADRAADVASDAAAQEDKYSSNALQSDGWRVLPKGAGRKGLNIRTSTDGVVMYLPKKGSGGGSGGSTRTTPTNNADLKENFRVGWAGKKAPSGSFDDDTPATFGPPSTRPNSARINKAAAWFLAKRASFSSGGKVDFDMISRFIDGAVPGINKANKTALMSRIRLVLKNG